MHDHLTHPFRPARLLTAALAVAATIAACGSSSLTASSSSTGRGSNATSSKLAFSNCMRASGVPNFPDLSSNRMLIQGNGQTVSVNGVSFNAPAYQGARAKCQRDLPPSPPASGSQQAQQTANGLRFARCMRSHGVPSFPDPKVVSHSGGNETVYLPGVNSRSPAFQAAAKTCGGPKGP
jgi:hypothetical protein